MLFYFYVHQLDASGNIVALYRTAEYPHKRADLKQVCTFKPGSKISLNITHALLFGAGSNDIGARKLTRHLLFFLGQKRMTASAVFKVLCEKGVCTRENRQLWNGKPHYCLPNLVCNIELLD